MKYLFSTLLTIALVGLLFFDSQKLIQGKENNSVFLSKSVLGSKIKIDNFKKASDMKASLLLRITPTPTQKPQPTPTKVKVPASQNVNLLSAVNQWRGDHGIVKMVENAQLCKMAEYRIAQLVDRGSLDNHEGFRSYLDINPLGSMGLSGIAENLAIGTNDVNAVVKMWENSPPHREQLLANPQMTLGCGAVRSSIGVLVGGY